MADRQKYEEIDPEKIIEEMKEEYWRGVTEPEEEEDEDTLQSLLFELSGERFAVDAVLCKTVTKAGHVTRVPRMPSYLKGVFNLRGEIISVVDMAELFGLGAAENWNKARLVVTQCGDIKTAFLVDQVLGIEKLKAARMRDYQSAASPLKEEYVKGHIEPEKEDEPWIIYLDLEKIIRGSELSVSG